jgi:signal transduction histidine kinase
MDPFAWLPVDPHLLGYVLAFGFAAVACFAAVSRARRVSHDGTRQGLVWLLLTSGAWAASHVGFLLAPTADLKLAAYYVGLTVGFAAVGPWLYFCSAYTGRSFHRSTVVQRVAIVTYLAVMAVKFTNPVHGYYFRTMLVETPFPHLTVVNGPAHWIVMGLAYALSAVGYFMLVELFFQVGHDTRPLVALIGLSGLPVLLDVAGAASPVFLDITYEPLGVAAMAVGLLYVYIEDFQTVRLAGEREDPVIVLDDEDRIRDYNSEAEALFPSLSVDEVIDSVVPEVAGHVDAEETVVEIDRVGEMRYYQLSANPFTTATAGSGQQITLTDITDREQYRTRLERQNERLERFAGVVSHDLRNPITAASGRIELAREKRDDEDLQAASEAVDRMEELVDDLLTLAREGQPISETEPVALSTVVEDARAVVPTRSATIELDDDFVIEADPDRVQQLLENLFRNALEHGSTSPASHGADGDESVTITVGALEGETGFYVADDGPGIPPGDREEVLTFGFSTAENGTGFGLAIVSEIAEAHGWEIQVAEGAAGGARFEVTGVAVGPGREAPGGVAGSD